MNLPKPSPNLQEYARIFKNRLDRFPKCKENYNEYLAMLKNGFTSKISVLPIKMDYEVSSICNFRCRMCNLSDTINKRPKQMTFKEYVQSLDEQIGLVEVKLQGVGEPLLNQEFFRMVHETVSRDIWVRTTTNGSLFHINDNFKRLIDEKIGEIQISIDGAKKETFEYIRRGSNFEQVIENVKRLNKYALSKGEEWRTSCWMLVQKDNFKEVEKVLELAEYMNFTRVVYSLTVGTYGGIRNWEKINKEKDVHENFTEELGHRLIELGKAKGITVSFWQGTDKYEYTPKKNRICNWLFSRAYITGDLDIVPCCEICEADTIRLGDANHFLDSWNGVEYVDFREQHLKGNIPSICKSCYANS